MPNKSVVVCGLLLALPIVMPRPIDAQTRIRLNAGTTFATLEGEDAADGRFTPVGETTDLGNETGFFAGASLKLPLLGPMSISPGLYFVQKGTSFKSGAGTTAGSVELSYIEIPVTINVAVTGTDRPFGVGLFAGPEIAFEIDCDRGLSRRPPGVTLIFNEPFHDCDPSIEGGEGERKSTLWGLVFGADVSFDTFFVNGGLDIGLTSMDNYSPRGEDIIKNSAWFLGAGILIGG